MGRPPRKIPIAAWGKGIRQNPVFQRGSQLAGLDALNLEVEGQGRPVPRLGYVVDTELEVDGIGNRFIKVHDLGNQYRDPVSRAYRLNVNQVTQYDNRRLFIVDGGGVPTWRDIQSNKQYLWHLPKPKDRPTLSLNVLGADAPRTPIDPNDPSKGSTSGNTGTQANAHEHISEIRVSPNPIINQCRVFITLARVFTLSVKIINVQRQVIRTLHSGELPIGLTELEWDGTNNQGERVALGQYFVAVEDANGKEIRWENIAFIGVAATNADEITEAFIGDIPDDKEPRYGGSLEVGDGFRESWYNVVYTYANPEFGIETAPSEISKIWIQGFRDREDNRSPLQVKINFRYSNLPDWATRIRVYASRGYVPDSIEDVYELPAEFHFQEISTFGRETTDEGIATEITWVNERTNKSYLLPSLYQAEGIPTHANICMIYAERMWVWDTETQFLRFSELGQYDNFPPDYALELSKSGASQVSAMMPAPSTSAFFVFKQDAIHVVRGSARISGLRQKSLANTDLDTSGVVLQHGTLSPRTIVSGDNGIYFIGRDRRLKYLTIDGFGTTNIRDVGIAIEEFLAELTDDELKNLVAFLFDDCYHIIMPDFVLKLDISRRYWVRYNWYLLDAFWSEGGIQGESILYAIRSHDTEGNFTNDIVRLYEGEFDGEADIPCEWESHDVLLPFETNVTGVVVQHSSPEQELSAYLFIDDKPVGQFTGTPSKGNRFRIPCFGRGHLARVRLRSEKGIPLISELSLEIP